MVPACASPSAREVLCIRAMKSLNVLLVVYAFPPAGGVGVLRASSLARYFPQEGIRLDVLTTRNPSSVGADRSLLSDIPAEVTIHRTITLDLPFNIKKRIKRIVTAGRPPVLRDDSRSSAKRSSLVKRALQDLLLPDPQVLWLPIVKRVAPRIIQQRSIDVVLITGGPFSVFLIAEKLRREFPTMPIVLDFRDEWLSSCFGPASFQFNRSERARQFAIKAEASDVASATCVVTVTEAARREIRCRYPDEPDSKFVCVPNGFDATRVRFSGGNCCPPQDRVVVAYAGTVYSTTEPSTLIRGLEMLPADIRARLVVRFIGHVEEPRYREALLCLGKTVELVGYLPQREALNAMNDANYALLITHDRLNISAKFYDYIGAGKPILGCVRPDGEARRLLETLHAGWWADSRDPDAIRQLFVDAVLRCDSPEDCFRPDRAGILQYERKVIASSYARLLHHLCGRETESTERLSDREDFLGVL